MVDNVAVHKSNSSFLKSAFSLFNLGDCEVGVSAQVKKKSYSTYGITKK
jgi:hypothetical protein